MIARDTDSQNGELVMHDAVDAMRSEEQLLEASVSTSSVLLCHFPCFLDPKTDALWHLSPSWQLELWQDHFQKMLFFK